MCIFLQLCQHWTDTAKREVSYLNLMTLEGFVHYGGEDVAEQSGSQTWQPGSREKRDAQGAFSCPSLFHPGP